MLRSILSLLIFLAATVPPTNCLHAADLSPGHRALNHFRRGVNLGNYLEAPRGQNWGASYDTNDFRQIRAEGFDHVRLPVAWHHYAAAGPDARLSPEIFLKVDQVVTNALKENLGVILNLHHFDSFTSEPEAETGRLLALWDQIARHYAKSPATVAFEILNEPKDKATTVVMSGIYPKVIERIRQSNPGRTLLVGPGNYNNIDELPRLSLPASEQNLIVTVHCYEPFLFTHQGASWTRELTATTGIRFPGPPKTPLTPDPGNTNRGWIVKWISDYNTRPTPDNPSSAKAFAGKLEAARAWGVAEGRPVHVGEFGCYTKADAGSRANFHAAFRKALDEQGLAWALWDWKAGFRYWDPRENAPMPGMREALFGK